MLRDTPSSYGLITILLHWITTVLIIGLFGLGLYMVGLGYYDPWYHKAPPLHISLGLTLLMLMILRVVWRLLHTGKPKPLPEHSRPIVFAASAVKYLLYLLVFVVVIAGYLMTTADGSAPEWFGLVKFPAFVRLSPDAADLAGLIHEWGAWAIVVLAGFHALAALVHHFVIRDRTLMRMINPSS
jgi:cytochrome b561